MANAISAEKGRLNREVPTRTGIRSELIGVLENFIANQVHSMKDGEAAPVDDLLSKALAELETARYKIEKPFKGAEMIVIEPDKELTSLKSLTEVVHNPKDIMHLVSAIEHQFLFNQWVIFVTNDEKEIIINEKQIWDTFGLQCTKPCWALDYYNEILKLKAPVDFYRGKLILSDKQKEFGQTFEKCTGIRILREPFKMETVIVKKEKTQGGSPTK